MARLDVEFIDESCGFIAVNEDILERKIYDRLDKQDYSNLSTKEYEQLSPKRKGVLEWYPFKENATILELGAGMGALTELFAEKKCFITCVEIKKSRSEIIRKRFQNCANVQVVCDNPVLYETEEKFDYIVVHDIWGYIRKYNKCTDAYDVFLKKMKQYLNIESHIIIIADNRIALKYFAGSVDEYSKKLFVGLNKYKNYSYIRSFDKKEILDMLIKNGMHPQDIFYVNSDYYFADKIYTDYALQHVKYVGKKISTTYNTFSLFDQEIVYDTLQQNNVADRFVDAFIIDCYSEKKQEEKIVYYQAGTAKKNGIAIFLDYNNRLRKRELIKETMQYGPASDICIDDWKKIVLDNNIEDDELRNYLKKEINFPFLNPVDILKSDEKCNAYEGTEDIAQLIKEERLIQKLIGELYESE